MLPIAAQLYRLMECLLGVVHQTPVRGETQAFSVKRSETRKTAMPAHRGFCNFNIIFRRTFSWLVLNVVIRNTVTNNVLDLVFIQIYRENYSMSHLNDITQWWSPVIRNIRLYPVWADLLALFSITNMREGPMYDYRISLCYEGFLAVCRLEGNILVSSNIQVGRNHSKTQNR
jgi:hypothetical protein